LIGFVVVVVGATLGAVFWWYWRKKQGDDDDGGGGTNNVKNDTTTDVPVVLASAPAAADAWTDVRYLRIRRMDGKNEIINIHRLNAYYQRQFIPAFRGRVLPAAWSGEYGWQECNKETIQSLTHTTAGLDSMIELELGSVTCDEIVVVHRLGPQFASRNVGTRLELINTNGDVLFAYDFLSEENTQGVRFQYPGGLPQALLKM
jgi:hypothetical protein